MATRLLLVRHGHVADNDAGEAARISGWRETRLSPGGRRQVMRLRACLAAGPRPAAVYASPLRRAAATAGPLAEVWGLRLRLRASLREISAGDLEGWRIADAQRCFPDLWARNLAQTDESFRWPGGESYRAFRARALRAVRRIVAAHSDATVAAVTHAGVISQVVGALAGTSPARWGDFRPGNASITEVECAGAAWRVVRFDDRRHLDA